MLERSQEWLSSWEFDQRKTYSPLALGEVLPDLGAHRLVDVFAEGCVTCDPETQVKVLFPKGFLGL